MVRMNLSVEDDIPDLLTELSGSERKRGEYLTRIIRQLHAGQLNMTQGNDIEMIHLQMAGLAGKRKELEGRFLQMEKQLSAVISGAFDTKPK